MIEKPYFVILNHQNGSFMPLVTDDDNLAMFGSEIAATVAANENMLGARFGFEVFEIGCGI